MTQRPDKLTWVACNCGSPHCKLQYPRELGMFYQGTGFAPEEVKWLDEAWAAATTLRVTFLAQRGEPQ